MSKIIDLSGANSKTIYLEKSEIPQFLVFENVLTTSKVEVELEREAQSSHKFFPKMPLIDLLEIQHKLASTLNNNQNVIEIGGNIVSSGVLSLSLFGEVLAGENDKIKITLSDLGGVNSIGKLHAIGGRVKSSNLFELKTFIYDANQDEKAVDVEDVDFLFFKVLPDNLEVFVQNDAVRLTGNQLKLINKSDFGAIIYESANAELVVGTNAIYMLHVQNATNIFVKDATQANDFKFYGIKI